MTLASHSRRVALTAGLVALLALVAVGVRYERETLYPSPWIAWRPFDNLGETGTGAMLLRTQPCIVVD